MSTQNLSVARFARNVKWDFFCDFQTLCVWVILVVIHLASRHIIYLMLISAFKEWIHLLLFQCKRHSWKDSNDTFWVILKDRRNRKPIKYGKYVLMNAIWPFLWNLGPFSNTPAWFVDWSQWLTIWVSNFYEDCWKVKYVLNKRICCIKFSLLMF